MLAFVIQKARYARKLQWDIDVALGSNEFIGNSSDDSFDEALI